MKTIDLCEFWDRFGAVILVFGPTLIFYLFLVWLAATKTHNETHVPKELNTPECLVKTTERGNRLHIVLDCPMIPVSAHEASTDEK